MKPLIPTTQPLRRLHSPTKSISPRANEPPRTDKVDRGFSGSENPREMPPLAAAYQRNLKEGGNHRSVPRNFTPRRTYPIPNRETKVEPELQKDEPSSSRSPVSKTFSPNPDTSRDQKPKEEVQSPKHQAPVNPVSAKQQVPRKQPACEADVTPTSRKIVPKTYVIETLPLGEAVFLSVDHDAKDCRTKQTGFVCLAMHETSQAGYNRLCDDYSTACEAEKGAYTLRPGETFSYFCPGEGWYRARCLTPTTAALIDSGRVCQVSPADRVSRLCDTYDTLPEYCCVINPDSGRLHVEQNLKCTLLEKTAGGYRVNIEDVATGAVIGGGEISRWLPEVEYPKPTSPAPLPESPAPVVIPEVSRPPLKSNSKVILVDMTAFNKLYLRPADMPSQRLFDDILQNIVHIGIKASPLQEPPVKGQIVISKYIDECFYRAMVKRTNVKLNKYLLEYIEFGNDYISTLENLYPCPDDYDLVQKPTVTSRATLPTKPENVLGDEAITYLEKLKEDNEPLLMVVPSGETAPSGSEVSLTVIKTHEVLARKLNDMCTPDWKKLEEKGGDVVDTVSLMMTDMEFLELPKDGCELEVLDLSLLDEGVLTGHVKGLKHAQYVYTTLTEQITKYCESELGRQPYLPKVGELCIALNQPGDRWMRAVFMTQQSGAGGEKGTVCFLDYGNMASVPVSSLRKMLPEFVKGLPAVAAMMEIVGFPKKPSKRHLMMARAYMEVEEDGRGSLTVTKCNFSKGNDVWLVHAPGLIDVLNTV